MSGVLFFFGLLAAILLYALWPRRGSTRVEKSPPPRQSIPSVVPRVPASAAASIAPSVNDTLRSTVAADSTIEPADDFRWIPLGETITWGNATIAGGGFYVGQSGRRGSLPFLVDQGLRISFKDPDWRGTSLTYYPNYAYINDSARGAFVGFLNSDRRNSGIGIGYVFLLFYGIEHRLLVDAPNDAVARAEAPALAKELGELLRVYGPQSSSVQNYFTNLIDAAHVLYPGGGSAISADPRPYRRELESSQLIGLGRLCAAKQPLPPRWALAWAWTRVPDAWSSMWECVLPEIERLFAIRYRKAHAPGLVVAGARKALSLTYRWAAYAGKISTLATALPDVSGLSAGVRPLCDLLIGVLSDLEPLRKVRRSKNRTPLAELLALPEEIRGAAAPPALAPLGVLLKQTVGEKDHGPVQVLPLKKAAGVESKLTKRTATLLAQAVEAFGFGMAPDVRFGGPGPEDGKSVVVFRLPNGAPRTCSAAFGAARLLVQAALAMATVDGLLDREVEVALRAVGDGFGLSEAERLRLVAHLELAKINPPPIGRIEAAFRRLPEGDRKAFARVLAEIAGADGRITPEETRMMERFYKCLALDPTAVHADLHAAVTGSTPATARSATALDPDAIARKLAETARVQATLAQIFVDDTPIVVATPAAVAVDFEGLDGDHAAVLIRVLETSGSGLAREEFDAWCEASSIMPDGALEALNDVAYKCAGEALLEGDDPLELNEFARQALQSKRPDTRVSA